MYQCQVTKRKTHRRLDLPFPLRWAHNWLREEPVLPYDGRGTPQTSTAWSLPEKRNKRRFGQGGLIDWGACIFHVVRDLWQHSKQDWGLATLSGAARTGRSVANRIEGCAVKNSCRPSRLGLIELHSLCRIRRRRHRLFSESLNTSTICLKGWYGIRNSCCF